ncbi:siderophore ABC transporter substrate-binding protein [Celeribacter litoreus]|uniref:siderophore ABC transporter substrate-binding protein n=1 Tax=Celeribacter litoreus TaxID=2876714 RepID=UPI001CCA018C|nr:siderophore ABC transporter substrate-binding protein [Celeribacter litoreus]MCA0042541.1 siderophore ABC transporter substrate-binding protein [Celeribacter litoreus]
MRLLAATFSVALTPLVAFAAEVTVPAWDGTATVETSPKSVVAFDLAAIDTLNALGVTLDGIPSVAAPTYLKDVFEETNTVGTLFEPDLEALAILGPDLIVAGGRSQEAIGAMREVAPTLDMTIEGEDLLAESKARTKAYGAIFEKEAEAAELIGALDAKLEDVRSVVADKGNALILMTNGGKLSAYGDDSRFGWLHTETGIPEAYPDVTAEDHGQSVSFEFIADVNPDWILVIDRLSAIGREGEAAAATLDNPLVAGTTAGTKGQIIYLDSAALYLAAGGATATQIVLDQLIEGYATAGS